jgi:hypothetical protein
MRGRRKENTARTVVSNLMVDGYTIPYGTVRPPPHSANRSCVPGHVESNKQSSAGI